MKFAVLPVYLVKIMGITGSGITIDKILGFCKIE